MHSEERERERERETDRQTDYNDFSGLPCELGGCGVHAVLP